RVPDLRGAADPAAHNRRPYRLDGALRDGRLPAVLGAGRPRPGRARGHRRQGRVPADDGNADLHHLRGEDVHAVGSEPIPAGRVVPYRDRLSPLDTEAVGCTLESRAFLVVTARGER